MSHNQLAKEFLQRLLSKKVTSYINIKSLKPDKNSFVSGHLTEYISDLLFSAKLGLLSWLC